jgi:hypothetical protein
MFVYAHVDVIRNKINELTDNMLLTYTFLSCVFPSAAKFPLYLPTVNWSISLFLLLSVGTSYTKWTMTFRDDVMSLISKHKVFFPC